MRSTLSLCCEKALAPLRFPEKLFLARSPGMTHLLLFGGPHLRERAQDEVMETPIYTAYTARGASRP